MLLLTDDDGEPPETAPVEVERHEGHVDLVRDAAPCAPSAASARCSARAARTSMRS